MVELPDGWAKATFAEIASYISRGRSPKYVSKSGLPVINQRCIRWHGIEEEHLKFVDPTTWHQWSDKRFVQRGDLLWNSTGRGTIGRATMFNGLETADQSVVDSHVTIVRSEQEICVDYLFAYIKSPLIQENLENMQSGSTNQVELNKSTIEQTFVPIAPFVEQKRIVAKIESLTTRTARARTDLDRVPALVEKYKSAILDLAFSGKLTADLRGDQGDDKAELPQGWEIKLLGDIGEVQGGIQVGKKRSLTVELVEVPYLRVANVQRGWLNLDEIKSIAVTQTEKQRLVLRSGDVLMNEGGDRDKLGRGWVWEDQVAECIHQNHVFRIRIKDGVLPPKFLSHYANEKGQRYFIDEGTQTTNLASISKRKIIALPVPVPPAQEAAEIVRRIETAFDWLSRISADHATATKLLPKLDAAILSKAFSGALVPQDPNDEPAGVLLARIQSERGIESRKTSKRRKKVKQMSQQPSERLLQDSENWPDNGLSFEELAKRIKLPHDQMRDVLFSLLAAENPKIRQAFDTDAERIHLRRVEL